MAVQATLYGPALSGGGGATSPVTLDNSASVTDVPLTIINAKASSGLVIRVSGTAPSGVVFQNSSSVMKGSIGFAVAANDWITGTGVGDLVIQSSSYVYIRGQSSGVKLVTNSGNGFWTVDDSVGLQGGYGGTVRVSIDSTGLVLGNTTDVIISSVTGSKLGQAASKIGLWGATPVVQYATTGTSTGFTAGAGTTVTHLSTFTGGLGSTAYTPGDLVLALKRAGVVAQ